MERGFVDEVTTDESLSGLKLQEYASCAACEGSCHIESDAESEGTAPCSAAESLRPGGDDAEVGRPPRRHGDCATAKSISTSCKADTTGRTLDELMLSTRNLAEIPWRAVAPPWPALT